MTDIAAFQGLVMVWLRMAEKCPDELKKQLHKYILDIMIITNCGTVI